MWKKLPKNYRGERIAPVSLNPKVLGIPLGRKEYAYKMAQLCYERMLARRGVTVPEPATKKNTVAFITSYDLPRMAYFSSANAKSYTVDGYLKCNTTCPSAAPYVFNWNLPFTYEKFMEEAGWRNLEDCYYYATSDDHYLAFNSYSWGNETLRNKSYGSNLKLNKHFADVTQDFLDLGIKYLVLNNNWHKWGMWCEEMPDEYDNVPYPDKLDGFTELNIIQWELCPLSEHPQFIFFLPCLYVNNTVGGSNLENIKSRDTAESFVKTLPDGNYKSAQYLTGNCVSNMCMYPMAEVLHDAGVTKIKRSVVPENEQIGNYNDTYWWSSHAMSTINADGRYAPYTSDDCDALLFNVSTDTVMNCLWVVDY